jgi:predicted Rossmann-fold nucleotide-binding protein
MRVTISSSSSTNIDQKYYDESRKVLEYLADEGFDLNWGSADYSIMGLCYEVFRDKGRNIYGYTSEKYKGDIERLPDATHTVYEDTFDLKKHIFTDADLVLILPGGTGSISEFFAYLEEIRSNDKDTKLVVYNVDHQYDCIKVLIDSLIKEGFNKESIYDYYEEASSVEQLREIVESLKNSKTK